MNRITVCIMTTLAFLYICAIIGFSQDSYWDPTAQPRTDAGKVKTLNQIEPRTIISSLPYVITNSGSYSIVGVLKMAQVGTGIVISTSHVKLDLNGFPIVGTNGSSDGIAVDGFCDNVSIRNGVICNWNGYGVNAADAKDIVMTDLKAFGNGLGGLYAGPNALLERCAAYNNGLQSPGTNIPPSDDGIQAGPYSTMKDCKSRFNRGAGIHTYEHSRITDCTASESQVADGIHVQDYCTVRESTAAKNASHGITVGSYCRVVENTCGQNGSNQPAAGIVVLGTMNQIENNTVFNNPYGILATNNMGKNLIICNRASGNMTNYFITNVNYRGEIWMPPSFNQGFSNSNPYVNFFFF